MKAYNLAMATIFINAGLYVTSLLGMFGDLGGVNNSFMELFNLFATPIITISGLEVRGVDAIAAALAVGTIVVLNSNAINDRGVAYTVFTAIFWGSFFIASASLANIDLPGVEIFYMIYFLASAFIFVITLVQMPVGGQKGYV